MFSTTSGSRAFAREILIVGVGVGVGVGVVSTRSQIPRCAAPGPRVAGGILEHLEQLVRCAPGPGHAAAGASLGLRRGILGVPARYASVLAQRLDVQSPALARADFATFTSTGSPHQ
jgi:hypothetical protein